MEIVKLKLVKPIENWKISQFFGENINPTYAQIGLKGHNGLDIPCPMGTPVRAAHDGVVVYTGVEANEGMGVVIRTHDAFDYNGGKAHFKTLYWHNIYPDGIKVKLGQHVKAGEVIALSDSTGNSTGPHLHFGLKPVYLMENDWQFENAEHNNGFRGAIDPYPYFERPDHIFKTTQLGEKSEEVKHLQTFLKELGFFSREVTGYYGPITQSAVMDFQIRFNVASLAELFLPWLRGKKVGPKSLAKLQALYGV